jgi:hypothetical protein
MLRVVCGQCGKKLEIPDAWARNVVRCPQCREAIDLSEADSAEYTVKLGQFLDENLKAGQRAAGEKTKPGFRPLPQKPTGPVGIAMAYVSDFSQRHSFVMATSVGSLLLILLDATVFHTGIVTMGAIGAAVAAAAAWQSEVTSHLPSAAKRGEVEFKVALGLLALLALRLAWFCYSEISTIAGAEDMSKLAPAFALLPKWGAITVVLVAAAIPLGAAACSMLLVERFGIYHVLSLGLAIVALGYGLADVTAQQMAGMGIDKLAHQQLTIPPPVVAVVPGPGTTAGTGPNEPNQSANSEAAAVGAAIVEPSVGGAPAPAEPVDLVPWTASVDPPPTPTSKIGPRLPTIRFPPESSAPISPSTPSAWLAVGDNRHEHSLRQLWDLSQDLPIGELPGQIEFVEPVALSPDEPVIAGYLGGGGLVEAWSLATGEMVGRVACGAPVGGSAPFIDFLGPEELLLVYGRGPDPHAPPMCQIWNFPHGEMIGEFPAIGCTADQKVYWKLSPGRRYLVAADDALLHVYDLVEKRLVGRANFPSVPSTTPLKCAGVNVSADGQQVIAIFHNDKKSRLIVWNLADGQLVSDGEFNTDLGRGTPPECRAIESLGAKAGWLAFERVIIPPFVGKQVRASSISQSSQASGVLRLTKVLDNGKMLVICNRELRIVKPPVRTQANSKELVTLAYLLTGAAHDGKPEPAGGDDGPGGDNAVDRASRAFRRAAYIDFLSSDDAQVNEQIRWAPWSKRPVYGSRWGLGVIPTSVSAKTTQKQQLEPVAGAPGQKLIAALDERLADGKFGIWPSSSDPRISRVAWLGIGSRTQLSATAKRQDLDVVAVVNVTWGKGEQRQISVRVIDFAAGAGVLSTNTLRIGLGNKPGLAGANASSDSEATEKWLSDVLRQIDDKMTLRALPELTPDDAKQAVERMFTAKQHDLASDMIELRAYQARRLIDEASLIRYYDALLGSGMGQAFVQGDSDARREILQKIFPAD